MIKEEQTVVIDYLATYENGKEKMFENVELPVQDLHPVVKDKMLKSYEGDYFTVHLKKQENKGEIKLPASKFEKKEIGDYVRIKFKEDEGWVYGKIDKKTKTNVTIQVIHPLEDENMKIEFYIKKAY